MVSRTRVTTGNDNNDKTSYFFVICSFYNSLFASNKGVRALRG